MKKFALAMVSVIFLAGIALAGPDAETASDNVLILKWQRVVDKDGKTCDRCGATEVELKKAMEMLEEKGVKAELNPAEISVEDFTKNCSESNRIWINDKPIEEVLEATVGASKCSGVCTSHKADATCRTLVLDGKSYESIPAELIVKAGLMAQGQSTGAEVQKTSGKSLGCAKSCVKTCGEAAAAACAGAKKD
ncbi:MAG TPA: DUF2703 domain-containing protein [candidate division Zixibacteria bacterium]|nr:DUF2703 domain-containing protein [candidate division Zixibacteria bacterium]